mgnify:CR=1 FL=1
MRLITVAVEKQAGIKFTYVPFKGGGDVAVQLVGKHIDSSVNNPIEAVATNVDGARNVIDASLDSGVQKVLAIPPSAELAPDQTDEADLMPYVVLDDLLFLFAQRRMSLASIG